MQMMYEIIAKELKSMNVENSHPQDYLNFFCLGNREQMPSKLANSSNHKNGDMVMRNFEPSSYKLK